MSAKCHGARNGHGCSGHAMLEAYQRDFLVTQHQRNAFECMTMYEQLQCLQTPPSRKRQTPLRLTAASLRGPATVPYDEKRQAACRKQTSPPPPKPNADEAQASPHKKRACAIESWTVPHDEKRQDTRPKQTAPRHLDAPPPSPQSGADESPASPPKKRVCAIASWRVM